MIDLTKLNNEQKEAVLASDHYIRVIASPGSGKTRTLTYRYAYLLENVNISSDNILCITYTNKAANDMKKRIIKLVNSNNDFRYISTIHSYCNKFLHENIDKINAKVNKEYTIFDDNAESILLEKISKKNNKKSLDKASDLKKIISNLKHRNKSYIEYVFGKIDRFSFGRGYKWADEILEICRNNNALFFDDLIFGALYILNNYESIRIQEQKKFKYVMVDEFQDTTPETYEIMKILSSYHKNLFVVGDPDQSIYEFIGANPKILLKDLEKDFPKLKTIIMNTNYRSTNRIINLSNELIKNNKNRIEQKKSVGFSNIEGDNVVYHSFFNKNEQYYNICRIIEHLHNNLKFDYKDIFVIARNNYCFSNLKKELNKNNIPFVDSRSSSSKKTNITENVNLIVNYLTFAINQNMFTLYNINNIESLGINEKEIEKYLNVNIDPIEFLKSHNNKKIESFISANEIIKKVILSKSKKVSEIIQIVISEYKILERNCFKDEEFEDNSEIKRLSTFIENIIDEEQLNSTYSIHDFLGSAVLDFLTESDRNNEECVHLMTAHGSKGLEADNIIIFDYELISSDDTLDESERRLSYVAFTRAKKNLFILSGRHKNNSSFVKEFEKLCININQYFENIKIIEDNEIVNKISEGLNEEKKKYFDILTSGQNVFLTGEAGTGKTFLINKYIDYLKKTNKTYLICAPTGIAAANYDRGITIHKAFNIPIIPSIISLKFPINKGTIINFDTIIIDEISMCRIDIFHYIMRVIEACQNERNKPIQVIVCGDFFQLPPVMTEAEKSILKKIFSNFVDGFAFESNKWEEFNFNKIILKDICRQNNIEFINALNNARKGINIEDSIDYINNNCSKIPLENAIEIHAKNNTVNNINLKNITNLITREHIYKAKYDKDTIIFNNLNIEDTIILKPGCRVMMLCNDSNLRYQNGSLGTVVTCGNNYIDVFIDKQNEIVRIYENPFTYVDEPILNENGTITQNKIGVIIQIPVKLAYAITIHKSQGQTFERANLDPCGWESGQIYVALSRITDVKNLYLYNKLDKDSLKVSKSVIEFYEKL